MHPVDALKTYYRNALSPETLEERKYVEELLESLEKWRNYFDATIDVTPEEANEIAPIGI